MRLFMAGILSSLSLGADYPLRKNPPQWVRHAPCFREGMYLRNSHLPNLAFEPTLPKPMYRTFFLKWLRNMELGALDLSFRLTRLPELSKVFPALIHSVVLICLSFSL